MIARTETLVIAQEKSHATMQVMDGFVHVWCLGRSSKRE
jgi:hypothetical protein